MERERGRVQMAEKQTMKVWLIKEWDSDWKTWHLIKLIHCYLKE
jgi:hypothetical protein